MLKLQMVVLMTTDFRREKRNGNVFNICVLPRITKEFQLHKSMGN